VAAAVAPLSSRLDEIAQNQQALAEQYQQQYVDRVSDGYLSGRDVFAQAHPDLTQDDLAVLDGRARQSGMYAAHLDAVRDPSQAAVNLLEQLHWADPGFREAEIARQVAAASEDKTVDDARKHLAAAPGVGGTTSSAAQQVPAPIAGPVDANEIWKGAVDDLRKMHAGETLDPLS
jgi:hypothetical protein